MELTFSNIDELISEMPFNKKLDPFSIVIDNIEFFDNKYINSKEFSLYYSSVEMRKDYKLIIYLIYKLFNEDNFVREIEVESNKELVNTKDYKELTNLKKEIELLENLKIDTKFIWENFDNKSKIEEVQRKIGSVFIYFRKKAYEQRDLYNSLDDLNKTLLNSVDILEDKIKMNEIVNKVKINYRTLDKSELEEYKKWLENKLLSFNKDDYLEVQQDLEKDYSELIKNSEGKEQIKYGVLCDIKNTLELSSTIDMLIAVK